MTERPEPLPAGHVDAVVHDVMKALQFAVEAGAAYRGPGIPHHPFVEARRAAAETGPLIAEVESREKCSVYRLSEAALRRQIARLAATPPSAPSIAPSRLAELMAELDAVPLHPTPVT